MPGDTWKQWRDKIFRTAPKPFWHEILHWKFFCVVFAIGLLAHFLSQFWVIEYAGVFAKDQLSKLRDPRQPQFTEIVEINGDDLEGKVKEFDPYGPAVLDPLTVLDPLSPAGMAAIIRKILQQDPDVVAVDIDTSATAYREIPSDLAKNPKVVWGRPGYSQTEGWGTTLHPLPVLGQRPDEEPPFSGLAFFPPDRDWTVRSYANCVDTADGKLPSFVLAILQAKEKRASSQCEPGEVAVHLLKDRYQFNTISLHELQMHGTSTFAGKIVLLGGSYSYLDTHPTPFGVMDGVKVVATAVETALQPEKSGKWEHWESLAEHWLLKFLLSLLLFFVHNRLKPLAAMVFTMLLLTFLVVFGMSIAYVFTGYSPDFVPFLIGIWIEQLFEGANEAEHGT